MSFALKQQKNEINLFTSLVYHISLCVFLTLLIIRNAAIAINILVYVIGNTLSNFTRQFIMIAAERSASIAKSCLVLVEFLAVNYIKYIDFDDQKQKVSEKGSIKNILTNASKRVQVPVKKGVTGHITAAPNTPVVSPEFLRKSEAARQIRTSKSVNKPTEASPVNSNFSALSLRKAEKEKLPLEKRYRSTVPSSLGNRPNDLKSVDYCPSKRYSTPASDAPKRTMTMKFINSTAANRVTKRKKQRRDDDDDDDVEIVKTRQQKLITKQKPEEINLNLSDERPSISKPSHTLYLNKPPEIYLQVARRYLKAMIKVKKHRNTI